MNRFTGDKSPKDNFLGVANKKKILFGNTDDDFYFLIFVNNEDFGTTENSWTMVSLHEFSRYKTFGYYFCNLRF